MHSVRARLKRVFAHTKADAIVVINTNAEDPNFLYLTGFTGGLFEGTVLIAMRNRLILLASVLEYQIALQGRPREMRVIRIGGRVKRHGRHSEVRVLMSRYLRGKTVGIDETFMPYRLHRVIRRYSRAKRLIDISEAFATARMVKDRDEIANIRRASRITKLALKEIKKELKTGVSERDIAAKFNYLMMKHGADGTAFNSIVSFGKNAALPHHAPDGTRLEPNSFVLFDVGAKYRNYCADVTRTLIFRPNKRSEKYKRMAQMLAIVREAQKQALSRIRVGAEASKAHNAAERYIDTAASGRYKGKFIHSLGHSLGLETHDVGSGLSPYSHFKLKEGMVFSDEPGIYIVGFGGVRIEDDVIVTRRGGVFI